MEPKLIKQLKEYSHIIKRPSSRANGVGPKLHDHEDRIWPRDSINPDAECRMILCPELIKLIDNEQQVKTIKGVIFDLFDNLKECNISNIFDKCCHLDHGYFDRIPFSVRNAMEAHTGYDKILDFVHQVIKAIKIRPKTQNSITYLFGCNRNFNIYKRHLRWLIIANVSMRRVKIGHFVHMDGLSMNLDSVEWLVGLSEVSKYRIFIQVIDGFTRFIAEMLRRYFYILVSNPYAHKLFYYRYNLWQKMKTYVLRDHLKRDLLFRFAIDDSINIQPQMVSKIRFVLKKNDIRLICTKVKSAMVKREIFHRIQAVLAHIIDQSDRRKFNLIRLLDGAKEMRRKAQELNGPIYFVRADIEDCFSSIKQDKLRSIILNRLRSCLTNDWIEFSKLRCTFKDGRPRNGAREKIVLTINPQGIIDGEKYDCVTTISTARISFEQFDRDYLSPQIVYPVLRESMSSKNGYNLVAGIRQGSQFSPICNAIYLEEAFQCHLAELHNADDSELFCYVDDILFMTTDLGKAEKFMKIMVGGFKDFRLKVNENKLACNFAYEYVCPVTNKVKQVSQLDDFVLFFRRKISLKTLQGTYNYSYNGITIDNTFHANPYFNQKDIYRSIERLAKIDFFLLDFELNSKDVVCENIFENGLLMAHRVATLFIISLTFSNHQTHQQPELLVELTMKASKRVGWCIRSGLKRKLTTNDLLSNEVHLIIVAAFLVTWQRNKVRHRAVERDRLDKLFNRCMMQYLTKSHEGDNSDIRGMNFETKIRSLIKNFPNSSFSKEVLLPDRR